MHLGATEIMMLFVWILAPAVAVGYVLWLLFRAVKALNSIAESLRQHQ